MALSAATSLGAVKQYQAPAKQAVPQQNLAAQIAAAANANKAMSDRTFTAPALPQQRSGYTVQAAAAAPAGPTAAQLDPLLASLGSLDTILNNRLGNAQSTYDRYINQYNQQDALDRQAFDTQTQTNNEGLASNRQAGLLNAARAGTGLRSVLSGLGGLAGSGSDLINRLVGQAANQDIGQADSAFKTNVTNLNTSWGQAEQQQRQRRADAQANLSNDQQNARADVLNSRKGIYEQLANAYGSTNAKGGEYASKAASLAPQIANTTRASVAPYAAASSSFSPAALTEYLAGTKDLSVNTSGSKQGVINSPLFSTNKDKDRLAGVA